MRAVIFCSTSNLNVHGQAHRKARRNFTRSMQFNLGALGVCCHGPLGSQQQTLWLSILTAEGVHACIWCMARRCLKHYDIVSSQNLKLRWAGVKTWRHSAGTGPPELLLQGCIERLCWLFKLGPCEKQIRFPRCLIPLGLDRLTHCSHSTALQAKPLKMSCFNTIFRFNLQNKNLH